MESASLYVIVTLIVKFIKKVCTPKNSIFILFTSKWSPPYGPEKYERIARLFPKVGIDMDYGEVVRIPTERRWNVKKGGLYGMRKMKICRSMEHLPNSFLFLDSDSLVHNHNIIIIL